MSSVEDIERAVSDLTSEDLRRFREWFAEFDAELRDRQIEQDVAAGLFDALIEEARAEHRSGRTRPL